MTRHHARLIATVSALALSALAVSDPSVVSADSGPATTNVIVVAKPGRLSIAEHTFKSLGGHIDRELQIIGGFAGALASNQIDALRSGGAVDGVSPDASVAPSSVDPALGYDPAETSSMSSITQIVGAQKMWNAGFTGAGVDVAVIDTGVARVPGLNATGKVIDGPDLSFDSLEPTLVYTDAFGHGTHMAGIIAGSDVTKPTNMGCSTCLGSSTYTDTTKFVGVAPGARVINVKVGAFDGAADVSQVIAAIDWVVQHRRDAGINIRVLNLSFGTDSVQAASLDPLVYAAEQAWKAGIVVVAAAGNDGLLTKSLASPAMSPSIIAVGTSDPNDTLATADDTVPSFAQHGSAARTVDVVAPGVSVLSLRVPGSFVDQNVTTGKVGTRFQRASGTSQSTAVVSGLAALLVSQYPKATPDMIKAHIMANAQPIRGLPSVGSDTLLANLVAKINSWYEGSGSASVDPLDAIASAATISPSGTGTGELEASRGSYHVNNGVSDLDGEDDIFGMSWDSNKMAKATAAHTTWSGGTWHGARWSGDGWKGARWSTTTWTSLDWSGARWSGARWSSMVWDGARWSGARWSGARWSDGSWDGARWSGARWSDGTWS